MPDRDTQRSRWTQVGVLMKAYREAFSASKGSRGLTQEELLRRMAMVDSQYADRSSHTMVSRWESGTTLPNRQRIEVFGKALNLSDSEVEELMTLAGFNTGTMVQPVHAEEVSEPHAINNVPSNAPVVGPNTGRDSHAGILASLGVRDTTRFSVMSCLLPGL